MEGRGEALGLLMRGGCVTGPTVADVVCVDKVEGRTVAEVVDTDELSTDDAEIISKLQFSSFLPLFLKSSIQWAK